VNDPVIGKHDRTTMKIVLFGAGGQVGSEVRALCGAPHTLVALTRHECDLARPGAAGTVLERERPDVVINAAAYTAVDRAESEPVAARRVNAEAVGEIAAAVQRIDGFLVHYSTDYVFDGTKPGRYVEDDVCAPQSVYGSTKREGEEAIAAAGCRALVLRTSWVHGRSGGNFVRTILGLAGERDTLSVVDDQFGAPTSAGLIAAVTMRAVERLGGRQVSSPPILHLSARGETSWWGLARFILEEAIQRGARLRLHPDKVVPVTTAEYPRPARRPANSRLETGRLEHTLGYTLPPWQDGVRETVVALLSTAHRG